MALSQKFWAITGDCKLATPINFIRGTSARKLDSFLWRPVLVKIMTIKLHYKTILIPLQQILWTCCIFLSSINNTFFSVLVIIFSNMSYFCFNYTNTFFIHTGLAVQFYCHDFDQNGPSYLSTQFCFHKFCVSDKHRYGINDYL